MGGTMKILIIYIIGWILFATMWFCLLKIEKSNKSNSLSIYESIKIGIFSWAGVVAILISSICILDEYLTNKLK